MLTLLLNNVRYRLRDWRRRHDFYNAPWLILLPMRLKEKK